MTSVWSSYGHRFITGSEPRHDECLVCGAVYEIRATPDGIADSEYVAADGTEPMGCTGVTGLVHGYPGERYCLACWSSECVHCQFDCNCLLCA